MLEWMKAARFGQLVRYIALTVNSQQQTSADVVLCVSVWLKPLTDTAGVAGSLKPRGTYNYKPVLASTPAVPPSS